jgi:hypothetical protein
VGLGATLSLSLAALTALTGSGAPAADAAPSAALRSTAGTTLAEVVQQARASQAGPDGSIRGKPLPAGAPNHHHGADGAQARDGGAALAALAEAVPGEPVQGPTDLDPAVGGLWVDGPVTPAPMVHSVVLHTGKVLIIAGSANQQATFAAGTFTSTLWDPVAGTFAPVATPTDMFCNGHVVLSDGRVLVAGGTEAYPAYDGQGRLATDWRGSRRTYVFNPWSERYEPAPDMAVGRWYPTLVHLGDDRVLAVAGLDEHAQNTATNEVFTPGPASTPTAFDTAGSSWAPVGTHGFPHYAALILRADGTLFYTGQSFSNNGHPPGVWDPWTGAFHVVEGLPARWQRNAGASVLLPPAQAQKVMVLGGGDWELPALADTHVIDLTQPSPAYVPGPDMDHPKMYVGAVVLPDYTVLQTGGAAKFRVHGVRDAEIYDPATNAWTTMNSPTADRLYHSSAFLLPDGRVASLGSQALDGTYNLQVQLFSPPYLFRGQRPAIGEGPGQLRYAGQPTAAYRVTTEAGAPIARVALVRPSATTHSTDTEQRLVDLPFTQAGDLLTVTPPANPNLAPPGWYMLVATDTRGRPSPARWVTLR